MVFVVSLCIVVGPVVNVGKPNDSEAFPSSGGNPSSRKAAGGHPCGFPRLWHFPQVFLFLFWFFFLFLLK